MKMVELLWDDAQGSGGWMGPDDIDHQCDRITSVGWLVRRDDLGVTICQSYNGSGRIADTLFVPTAYLQKLRVVRA